jgi:hypothetical protein
MELGDSRLADKNDGLLVVGRRSGVGWLRGEPAEGAADVWVPGFVRPSLAKSRYRRSVPGTYVHAMINYTSEVPLTCVWQPSERMLIAVINPWMTGLQNYDYAGRTLRRRMRVGEVSRWWEERRRVEQRECFCRGEVLLLLFLLLLSHIFAGARHARNHRNH